jgi:hypothetical protein
MAIKFLGLVLATVWVLASPPGAPSQTPDGLGGTSVPAGKPIGSDANVDRGDKPRCLCAFAARDAARSVPRFTFEIEPSTPLNKLLPLPHLQGPPPLPWLVKDLTQVPEILFQKPLPVPRRTPKKIETGTNWPSFDESDEELDAARQQVALTLARINHVNQDSADRFLAMLVENRSDLAGLPFLKGAACRMSKEVSQEFVREAFMDESYFDFTEAPQRVSPDGAQYDTLPPNATILARVAAWMQTSPEKVVKRKHIVKVLGRIQHPTATLALGKLAVFAPEKSCREEALAVLKDRPRHEYTKLLLDGLRYPWPNIANNAADAIVKLKRADLVGHLVDFLDEPDPRAPFDQNKYGRSITLIRELVRLNHHHNCITCHAPATSDSEFNKSRMSSDFVTATVTIPNDDSLSLFAYLGTEAFPDLAVRADVTYLRQDFSVMQKVENGMTGKAEERFDFLVRTREMKDYEVMLYRDWLRSQGRNYLSPNHQAALTALQCLTGLDAGPTAKAWRQRLKAGKG